MYINLTLFKNTDLSADQLLNLVYIKQVAPEMINVEFLKEFEERGYIKYNKRKNASQNVQELVRLDKKGKDLLVKLSFEGTVDEECEKLGAWLISQYKNTDGKIVKNKTEILRRLQWYKTITGISGNFLALLISCAIKDTYNNDCGMIFFFIFVESH